jgi:hypothetical protein
MTATTVSVSIERPCREVYDFVAHPPNLPRWATGLARAVRRNAEGWIGETAQGTVRLRFAPPNDHGVADHYVSPPSGGEVYVPVRVVANGAGSEVLITVFRLPDLTDAQYRKDLRLVRRDLEGLKRLLESTR